MKQQSWCRIRSRKVKNSRGGSRKGNSFCTDTADRPRRVYFTTKLCFPFIRVAWKVVHIQQKVRKLQFRNRFSKQRRALKLSKQMKQTTYTYFSIFNSPYQLEGFVVWLKLDYLCWLEFLNRGTVQFDGLILLFWSFDGTKFWKTKRYHTTRNITPTEWFSFPFDKTHITLLLTNF